VRITSTEKYSHSHFLSHCITWTKTRIECKRGSERSISVEDYLSLTSCSVPSTRQTVISSPRTKLHDIAKHGRGAKCWHEKFQGKKWLQDLRIRCRDDQRWQYLVCSWLLRIIRQNINLCVPYPCIKGILTHVVNLQTHISKMCLNICY